MPCQTYPGGERRTRPFQFWQVRVSYSLTDRWLATILGGVKTYFSGLARGLITGTFLLFVSFQIGCGPAQEPSATGDSSGDSSPAQTSFEWNLDESGYAIHGYDPVSYTQADGPKLGLESHEMVWGGAKWRFSSQENLDAFTATPDKYVPANGGYCTFGVVLSKKFDGDPTVWSVHDESVHLFLNEDVKEKFFQDTDGNFTKVVNNWPNIKAKAPSELE